MRQSTKFISILYSLFFIAFGYASSLVADESAYLGYKERDKNQWMCDYTTMANDVLYIRCDNLVSLMYDPLITDEAEQNGTQFIPIWRRPNNDGSAVKLVKAVLCDSESLCEVRMKSPFYLDRIANR